jgi:hypothetical protein
MSSGYPAASDVFKLGWDLAEPAGKLQLHSSTTDTPSATF